MRLTPFNPDGNEIQQEEVEVMYMLREAFGTEVGKQTLNWLLTSLGFAGEVHGPEGQALHNFAVYLLDSMGITQLPNMPLITEALLKMPHLDKE